ncbi:hypothetical protein BOTBODRAFT_107635 [Botryobasidium botryosum FD-172 SS1]|uniref:G domain-containing protein n=1 Tax=Botryobasidium botryosum (strain FD-172 SS1) TaxID=930990 RepID=A0A067MW37_BOTB1|nr:hypothetical protein BOTBODRAFT_107635 [Botryobasidium botryosum FD-172 SS1]
MTEPAQPERFRILIIGRGNAGKTTILRAVCGVDEEPEVYDGEGNKEPMSILSPTALRGEHRIDWELIFPSNSRFVFHDSCGFESGGVQEVEWVRKFIQDKAGLGSMSKQLHAIWYCFPADNTRLITAAEKEFFNKIDTGSVPVIAIITKFDALDAAACTSLLERGVPFEVAQEIAHLYATETFNKGSLPILEALAHRPKAVVHLRSIFSTCSLISELIQSTAASLDSDALKMLLVQAQRVNVELCMKGAVNRWVPSITI